MKLLIHAGLPKTGSTAIQSALWNSTEELKRCEISFFTGNREIDPPRCLTGLYRTTPKIIGEYGEEKLKEGFFSQGSKIFLNNF